MSETKTTPEKVVEAIKQSEHADLSRQELADELNVPYHTVASATIRLEDRGAIEVSRTIGRTNMYTIPE